ncbi:MAG: phage late control D family protein [Symbiopectobacterium sp.]|uniref:phage late control D family protein n=1 Tax=Symbiopectobacterium sp. TaxID=2952789 RepID=UPI0039EB35EE
MAALTPRSDTITPVDTPTFTLHYDQQDISREVTPYVLSVSFTDRLAGESDEVEVELEDIDGRWREAWYPGKGDSLTLAIGLAGQPLLACGTFSLDELEFSGPPDSVRLRGLSAPVTRALRTRSNRAFEATTLRAIASRIAKKHHLRLEGILAPLTLDRVTQYNETDLAFITRLGREYGYIVKVTDKALVFSHRATLREASPLLTLTPSDVSCFTLRDTLNRIYQQGKVKYQDTRTKKLVTVGVLADGSIGTVAEETLPAKGGRATSADTLQMQNRARTRDEAVGKLCAGLNRHNEYQRTANLSLPGQTRLKAGITVQLADFGRLSGVWLVTSVRHDLNRQSGYTCELELGQGPIANSHKKGKASKPQSLMVIGKKADGSIGVVATETPVAQEKTR